MKNLKYLAILSLAVGLAACSQKSDSAVESSADSVAMTEVTSIQIESMNSESLVAIVASGEPRYNVFKLTEPERVVVDLIDARLQADMPESIEGQGSVSEIRVQAIEDSLSSLVRIEVVLNGAANYLAAVEGDRLMIRLMAVSPIADDLVGEATPEESMPAPMVEVPMAEVPPAIPEVTPEIVPEAATEMKTELPATSTPEPVVEAPSSPPVVVAPVPVPVPVPMASEEKTEEAPLAEAPVAEVPAMPVPMADQPLRDTPQMPEARDLSQSPPVIETQDIPTSGLTEGTSLLTELDTKVYTGRRVSLEFQNADVQDILRLIADISKLNIITSEEVKGALTLKLIDVPWDQALDIILTTLSLDKVQHGNIIRVAPAEMLKKERETALANDKAAKQLEPLQLKLININYAKGDEMSSRIKNLLSERGTVDVDPRTNTLIVKDIREHVSRIENLVRVLDTQTPQVRIESRIVQANDNFSRNIGIQWGPTLNLNSDNARARDTNFPSDIFLRGVPDSIASASPTVSGWAVDSTPGNVSNLGFRLGSVSDIFDLDLRLSYAELENMARIVSRPSISVLDNRTARIIQGSKIPFLSSGSDGTNVSFQEAGIEVSVTPQVTNDGAVMMKISTKSNEPGSDDVGGNRIINIREADTEMLVKSGRTAVLGGVFKTTETRTESGVPGLKDIPVLGWLFKGRGKSQQRDELLIFVTPYIVTDMREALTAPASESTLEVR
jgi:type IV pilus assembly protein PilQ